MMLTELFLFLAKATGCLAVFSLTYRLVFNRLTHFQWNRIYLISALLLSIAIPLVQMPISRPDYLSKASQAPYSLPVISPNEESKSVLPATQPAPVQLIPVQQPEVIIIPYEELGYGLAILYLLGFIYKAWQLGCNLWSVRRLIRKGERIEEEEYCLVYTQEQTPAFSFLHFIFLGRHHDSLSLEEWNQLINHERVHVRQKHTLDLLLFEAGGIMFWFNPLIRYLKESLQEVHEYIADAAVTQELADHRSYGRLLVRLTVEKIPFPMANGFSGKQLKKRILMLTQTPSTPRQKLKFILVCPLLAGLAISCSMLKSDPIQPDDSQAKSNLRIGSITWSGNTLYSAEKLSKALRFQPGDVYDEDELTRHLFNDANAGDIASLYMNKGYYYFDVAIKQREDGQGRMNVELAVYEGKPLKIGQIILKGDVDAPRQEALRLIGISSGEWFSRKKLILGRRALEASDFVSGYVEPVPHPEQGIIDLECTVSKPRPWGLVMSKKPGKDSIIFESQVQNEYTFMLNGQPLRAKKGLTAQTRGLFSLQPAEGWRTQAPLKITISLKSIDGNQSNEKVSRTWEDIGQMRNFDIGELLSQSKPGDFLSILLEGEKVHCGTVIPIY